ncbi:hypothetical protein, partial [Roseateles sp. P5_E11]
YKKRSVMEPKPASPIECLRDIAYLNSGRLSDEVRHLLQKEDADIARWARHKYSRFTLNDLGALFDKSKSAVARWLDDAVMA